jgi:hypothetical protein
VAERLGVVKRGEEFRLVVDLERVRLNVNLAIDEFVKSRGRFITFDQDFYWQAEPSLDEHPEPGSPLLASLVDDYENGVTWFDEYPTERAEFAPLVLHYLGSLLSVMSELDATSAAPDDIAASRQAE